uniref:Uncharacterized protein n=1 Tax=Sphaerodactylus townsendi TaxID=933632 RepID=A0ACB8G3J1_9SAUR
MKQDGVRTRLVDERENGRSSLEEAQTDGWNSDVPAASHMATLAHDSLIELCNCYIKKKNGPDLLNM